MESNDFELSPTKNTPWDKEHVLTGLKEIAEHRLLTVRKLGYKFPIFRATRVSLVGQDLSPNVTGETSLGIEPTTVEEALKGWLDSHYSLTNIAWNHAKRSQINDPTLSWTIDIEVAKRLARLHGESAKEKFAVIQAEGVPLPPVGKYSELQANFGVYIPVLSEIRKSWPSPQSTSENEFVTFGKFPANMYQLSEGAK